MRRMIALIALIAAVGMLSPAPATHARQDCPGAPPTRLQAGQRGQVTVEGAGSDGLLRVRAEPGPAGEIRVEMATGDAFSVTGAPQCVEGLWWWPVVTDGGIAGWSAEGSAQNYFVQPLDEPALDPLPVPPQREVLRLGDGLMQVLAWNPAGDLLAVGTTLGIRFYDPALTFLRQLDQPDGTAVTALAWSADGSKIAAASSSGVIVWEVASGAVVSAYHEHSGPVVGLGWSPDGAHIASAGAEETAVHFWDSATGTLIATLNADDPIAGIASQPNGSLVAIALSVDTQQSIDLSTARTLVLWDVNTKQLAATYEGTYRTNHVLQLAWSPDGQRLGIIWESLSLSLWDIATGSESWLLRDLAMFHNVSAVRFTWSPDSRTAAAAASSVPVTLGPGFIPEDDRPSTSFHIGQSMSDAVQYNVEGVVRDLAWGPNGVRLAVLTGDALMTLDAATGAPMAALPNFRPEQQTFWDASGERLLMFDDTSSTAFTAGGQQIAVVAENQCGMTIKDAVSGEVITRINYADAPPFEACNQRFGGLSPDHRLVVSADRAADFMVLWDVATGAQRYHSYASPFPGDRPFWWWPNIQWSGDGRRLLSIYRDALAAEQPVRLYIWDLNDSAASRVLDTTLPDNGVFSPDTARLAEYGWGEPGVTIWDVASGQPLATLEGHTAAVTRASWSPDSARLATGSDDHTVMVWDVASGEVALTLAAHTAPITNAVWSADGTRLATAGQDATIRVWDTSSGQLLITLDGHTAMPGGLRWRPDGRQLLSVEADGTVRVWQVD